MKKHKKAQLDYPIITFAAIIIGLIIFAPIALKIFVSIKAPVSSSLANVSNGGSTASANFNATMNPLINFWDKIVIFAFMVSTLLLFVSAFMIDAHPFWIVLYIFISFMLVIFTPSIMQAADGIYENANFGSEVGQLSFMNNLRTHFGEFLVGIIVITGIIIYGKISLFPSSGGGSKR
jgi:hypothetical protein